MIDYIYLAAAAMIAVNAFSYGKWVGRQGNRRGALVMYALTALCLGLPLIRLIKGP